MDPRGEGELHSSTGLVAPGLNQHRRLRGNWRTDWALVWEAAAPLCRTKAFRDPQGAAGEVQTRGEGSNAWLRFRKIKRFFKAVRA